MKLKSVVVSYSPQVVRENKRETSVSEGLAKLNVDNNSLPYSSAVHGSFQHGNTSSSEYRV